MSDNYWDRLMETDDNAANYMLTYGEGPGCETRMIISSLINDGDSVLDVGCGPGWNYDHFRDYGPKIGKYLGLDYSRRFVRVANARNPKRYKFGDCRKLDMPDNSWNVVLLQDVLEHTNGFEKPVLEALRVASRSVVVSFWHMTEQDDHINDDGSDGYGAWYSKPKWERFINKLPYVWFEIESSPKANRKHIFYVIDKEIGNA